MSPRRVFWMGIVVMLAGLVLAVLPYQTTPWTYSAYDESRIAKMELACGGPIVEVVSQGEWRIVEPEREVPGGACRPSAQLRLIAASVVVIAGFGVVAWARRRARRRAAAQARLLTP